MAYVKALLRKGVKQRNPRMARKGASNAAIKTRSTGGDFSQAIKFLRDN